jgi:hypothetical protein
MACYVARHNNLQGSGVNSQPIDSPLRYYCNPELYASLDVPGIYTAITRRRIAFHDPENGLVRLLQRPDGAEAIIVSSEKHVFLPPENILPPVLSQVQSSSWRHIRIRSGSADAKETLKPHERAVFEHERSYFGRNGMPQSKLRWVTYSKAKR